MTAKIYIPALAAIVVMLAIITGIMVHRHERHVAEREQYRQGVNQALAASCHALQREGVSGGADCRPYDTQPAGQ